MNGFEQHQIAHLSPSSLNLWAAEPALWVMERLLNKRVPVGAAAHRGTAVEHGVWLGLFAKATSEQGLSVAECQKAALTEYDRLTALSGDPNRDKERDAVPGCVETALNELLPYGVPTMPPDSKRQFMVSVTLPDVPVPVIGYQDFRYEQHNMVVDLKTQLRLSSAISPAHARQGAIYVYGTNGEMRFTYCTPKKAATYRLEDVSQHINALRQIALRLGRFLALSKDPHELAGLLCPNHDSFYFNDSRARANAREVYGF